MGRYYSGDIEGKFWFAVQSSDDADFFGVTGYQPEHLEYEFEEENIDDVKKGIARCYDKLGLKKEALDLFFEKHNGYNNEMLVEEKIVATKEEAQELLRWYARLELGEKILASIKTNGHCYFDAEC